VSAFLALGDPLRATLRLALRRFNQALRRPPHGDRALDLAISLESLLVDGAGENTYKIGLRAALVLGGSMERRREVRAVVGALYALRSALIHDGILPSEVKVVAGGKRPAHDIVEDATEICALVLRSILYAGSIPSWYEYELGDTGRSP
jgi:Apea-like HEPN